MSRKFICLFPLVLALSLVLTSTATAELLGWWRLDEGAGTTAYDSSGNNNDGTLVGGPRWVAGYLGGALDFDGTDDGVTTGASLLSDVAQFTLAGWVSARNPTASRIGLFGQNDTVEFGFMSGNLEMWTASVGTTTTAWPFENETWHHVAAVGDGTNQLLYMDGELAVTGGTATANYGTSSYGVNIGGAGVWDASGNWFDGQIDDVRVYDHALTEEEIQILMLGGGAGYPFASRPNPEDSAMYTQTWANLTWRPGDFAVSHDYYIGADFDDVNEAIHDSDTYRGNTTEDWFIVGFAGYPYPTGLQPGTTYYWRIDEVNDANDESPWKGPVWSFWLPPKKAWNPNPPDGAKFVDPNADLTWNPGWGAAMYYVYFGDDYDTVKSATGAIPQAATTYDPGTLEFEKTYYWRVDEFTGTATDTGDVWSFTTVPYIPISDPNLVGWWKLDEGEGSISAVDWSGHGNHASLVGDPQWVEGYDGGALEFDGRDDYVTRGPIGITGAAARTIAGWAKLNRTTGLQAWSNVFGFSAVGGDDLHFDIEIVGGGDTTTAGYYGIHVYGWEQDIMPPDLEWHHFAASYDGTTISWYGDGMLVGSQSHPGLNTQGDIRMGKRIDTGGYFPGIVDNVRIYNRALDASEIPQTMRGDPLLAWDPNPANRSTPDIEHVTSLSWQPGDKAAQHDVYFGTDKTAVADADPTTPGIYRVRQAGLSYNPPEALQWGKTYYWRIDEYNTDTTISTGRIWSFTIADYLIVEDFESYTDDIDNRIFQTWIDGWGYTEPEVVLGNGTGSTVGHLEPPFAEQTIVHSGRQSMPFDYNNTGAGGKFYYSETERTWNVAQNWTREGVKALTLYFYGDPANDAEQLYVAIEDSAANVKVINHHYLNAVQGADWQEWNIDLRDITGINLTAVKKMYIGVGDRDMPQRGGAGTLYFDDIRLYKPRCVPSILRPDADIADPYDCKVDYKDLRMLTSEWLLETQLQNWEERAAYWDSRYRTNWASEADSIAVRDGLAAAGYTILNADQLKTWMDARIADKKLSVVVFCRDNAPDTVVESVDATCTLRRYLDAGGKIVFYADIPFWDIAHADGTWDNPQTAGASDILGFDNTVVLWDSNTQVTLTADGIGWGLTQTWGSVRPIATTDVTVLAIDAAGNAAAWVRHYLPGDKYRGFVRLWDRAGRPPVGDIIGVAECRLAADLYQDGAVDFKDFAKLADSWLEEVLWPQP